MTRSTAASATDPAPGDRAGAAPAAPALPLPGHDDREGVMATVVDEVSSLLVTAKKTVQDAATRFDVELPPSAFYVLRYVAKHGPCASGDVARAMNMDKSAVSRQVTSLREHGYVDVVADSSDGRVLLLTVTERATQRLLAVRHEHRATFRSHVDGWTDDELREFAGWLRRFNGND